MTVERTTAVELLDYRRRVADMYAAVRAAADPEAAWHRWRRDRDDLFRTHPQSPIDSDRRASFEGLDYFPYDGRWRLNARVAAAEPTSLDIDHSAEGHTRFQRFGRLELQFPDGDRSHLDVYWLSGYGGGVFLPFRDASAGISTYGGGRYLLDGAKGADLGSLGDELILDFNFAYHPSCVYSSRWSCPLAPAGNLLETAVEAGERL